VSQSDPNGPIILVGNSPKMNKLLGTNWSANTLASLRKAFPGRRVYYRPKPRTPIEITTADRIVADGRIEDILQGASLVVTYHSNVAVDACRLGIPCVAEWGNAASIYPRDIQKHREQPSFAQRVDFLNRLAYFQWSAQDVRLGEGWPWIYNTYLESKREA
jgi:hypothetical protein